MRDHQKVAKVLTKKRFDGTEQKALFFFNIEMTSIRLPYIKLFEISGQNTYVCPYHKMILYEKTFVIIFALRIPFLLL